MSHHEWCRNNRGSVLHIDSDALQHNFQRVRELAPASKVMPVIKADAYGHGMEQVAASLDGADAFAVAMLSEAVKLRESGCEKDIVVFHGFASVDDLQHCEKHSLQPAIHRVSQLDLLADYTGEPLQLWLKIDTGMHRLGVPMEQVDYCLAELARQPAVSTVRILSHFANADEVGNPLNNNQIENILKVKNTHDAEYSLANSAAVCSLPDSHFDWVRPGIMLYGASPLLGSSAADLGLKPVMRFESRLIAIQELQQGEAIGYGSSWQCPQAMRVGIVSTGYADGYPRHAPADTPVAVNGIRTGLIGRVSMDSLFVDLRGIDAGVGDTVELWGEHVAVDEVADCAGTIAYELLCCAGNAVSSLS